MKYFMTGSDGFIGQHLWRELAEYGHEIIGCDLKQGQDLRQPNYLDIAMHKYEPDAVIHLAAQVGRQFGEDDVQKSVADNAGMTALVARVCGDYKIPLVYASTSEVYGDIGRLLAVEDFRYESTGGRSLSKCAVAGYSLPHNIYGLSKRWGEDACNLYASENLLIWRISMPYGPGLPAGRGRAAMINFLYSALHHEPITVHRDSERSWCWIGDTVRAMRYTLEDRATGAFNIGRDDNPTSMYDVAVRACKLVGASESLITVVDPPERQTVVKRLSTEKIRSLDWLPLVDLDEGMERTLQWVKTL